MAYEGSPAGCFATCAACSDDTAASADTGALMFPSKIRQLK